MDPISEFSTSYLTTTTSSKLNHKWIILNFSHFYKDHNNENTISKVYSNSFLPPQNEHFNFSLRLVPNFVNKQLCNNVYLSIFIYREAGGRLEKIKLKCSYKISICDVFGKSIYFRVDRTDFACEDCWGFEKFILLDYICNEQYKLLSDNDELILNCEMEIANFNSIQLENEMSQISRPVDTFDAKTKVERHNFEWTIEHFSKLICQINSADYNDLPYIRSENFYSPSNEQIQYYIILHFKDVDLHKFRENISLYLHVESKLKEKGKIHYRVSILDWESKPFATGEGQGLLEEGKNFCRGSPNFVARDDIIKPQNGLLPEDTLTISVNIEHYVCEYSTEHNDHKSIDSITKSFDEQIELVVEENLLTKTRIEKMVGKIEEMQRLLGSLSIRSSLEEIEAQQISIAKIINNQEYVQLKNKLELTQIHILNDKIKNLSEQSSYIEQIVSSTLNYLRLETTSGILKTKSLVRYLSEPFLGSLFKQ